MTDYNIIVIGAGPAGSMAAKTAAERVKCSKHGTAEVIMQKNG